MSALSGWDYQQPPGSGPGWSGGNLASEILLNAITMLTSYALMADEDKRLKLEAKSEAEYFGQQTEAGKPYVTFTLDCSFSEVTR